MRSTTPLRAVVAFPARMGLTFDACLMMAKSALPATIAIAAMQSTTWATHFGSLNYLVAIEALLSHCILPRVQFLQMLLLNVLMTCLASAVNLLALWCAIEARLPLPGYDSSASAVLAIWFMLQVYLVNALRSSRPQFSFPCINYCIFTMIALAQVGPTCNTIEQAKAFVSLLLQTHLTGFAIAAGVSIFLLPRSNRAIALATTRKYITSLRGVLSDSEKVFSQGKEMLESNFDDQQPLKSFLQGFEKLRALDTKLKGGLESAVRDVGYGFLTGDDLESFHKHLHGVYLFMSGLRDIIEDLCALRAMPTCECLEKFPQTTTFTQILDLETEKFKCLIMETTSSLDDIESWLLKETDNSEKLEKVFATEKSDALPTLFVSRIANMGKFTRELVDSTSHQNEAAWRENSESSQFCDKCCQSHQKAGLIIQRERFVLWHLSKAVLLMLEFANLTFNSTLSQRKRIITPNRLVLFEWLVTMFRNPDAASHGSDILDGHTSLNPNNMYKHGIRWSHGHSYVRTMTYRLRRTSRLLRSPHSLFGFRAMCASMSIGIVAYLKDSHEFFVRQRLIWAIVMTMIAMKPTSGQTTFEFLLRIIASLAGTIASLVIWYIVNGHSAGVIVFLFFYMAASFYFCIVKPRYTILAIVSSVTPLISVGYSLNVQKLGAAYLSQSDTPDYPIYQVAAYRLVNVIAGLFVAYVWTFIPFPLTEHSVIRHSMGSCVFLLAQYNAMVSNSLLTQDRLGFDEGMISDLRQLRLETLHRTQKHLAKLRTLSAYVKWVFTIGEELQLRELKELIFILDQMTTHATSLGLASSLLTFAAPSGDEYADRHIASLNTMANSIDLSVSTLCLISASITNDLPLPPYLFLNEALDAASLSMSTSDQPANALPNEYNMDTNAIAVISAATEKIQLDVQQLTQVVKIFCGELDFSAKALSSNLEPQVSYDA